MAFWRKQISGIRNHGFSLWTLEIQKGRQMFWYSNHWGSQWKEIVYHTIIKVLKSQIEGIESSCNILEICIGMYYCWHFLFHCWEHEDNSNAWGQYTLLSLGHTNLLNQKFDRSLTWMRADQCTSHQYIIHTDKSDQVAMLNVKWMWLQVKYVGLKKLCNLDAIHLPDVDRVRCNGRGAIVEKVNLGYIIEGQFWINSWCNDCPPTLHKCLHNGVIHLVDLAETH